MSDERDDGGQVFPVQTFSQHSDGTYSEHTISPGLTLRDYFAAKAMQAELTTNGVPGPACDALVTAARQAGRDPVLQMAVCAYEMADAMLKARDE